MRLLLRKLPAIAPIVVSVIATLVLVTTLLETPVHGAFVRAYGTGYVENLDTLNAGGLGTGDTLTQTLTVVSQSAKFGGLTIFGPGADPDAGQAFNGAAIDNPGENVFGEVGLGSGSGYARADSARYDGTATGPPPTPPTLNGIGSLITTAGGGRLEGAVEAQAVMLGEQANGSFTYFLNGTVTDAGGDSSISVSVDLVAFLTKAEVDGFDFGFADASIEATLSVNGSGGTVSLTQAANAMSEGEMGGGLDTDGPVNFFLQVTAPVSTAGQTGSWTLTFEANAMAEGGEIPPVPEPAAWSLGAIGCLGLVLTGWRRRRHARC